MLDDWGDPGSLLLLLGQAAPSLPAITRHPPPTSPPTRAQIANQGDPLFDEQPSGGGGFFKSIFPCLRKGGGGNGSMAWVKLVDSEGRVAGHAVLSARISMGMLGGGDEVSRACAGLGVAAGGEVWCTWVAVCMAQRCLLASGGSVSCWP